MLDSTSSFSVSSTKMLKFSPQQSQVPSSINSASPTFGGFYSIKFTVVVQLQRETGGTLIFAAKISPFWYLNFIVCSRISRRFWSCFLCISRVQSSQGSDLGPDMKQKPDEMQQKRAKGHKPSRTGPSLNPISTWAFSGPFSGFFRGNRKGRKKRDFPRRVLKEGFGGLFEGIFGEQLRGD
ncbi:hypothetical protein Ancab_019467 [Ancistrocladus abbreviatus]